MTLSKEDWARVAEAKASLIREIEEGEAKLIHAMEGCKKPAPFAEQALKNLRMYRQTVEGDTE